MAQSVSIKRIEPLTHDVLRIITEKPESISYKPGHAVDVSINKEGWRDELRPFTFVFLEDEWHIEFKIKSYTYLDGVYGRLRSLRTGDGLLIGEVFGAIEDIGEGMFLAGGAGITPFLAIFNMLERDKKVGENTLLFANKAEKDIILKDKFEKLLGDNVVNILSDEENPNYEHGFINADLIERNRTKGMKYYYICGPDPMLDAVEKELKKLGVSDDAIITEDFS